MWLFDRIVSQTTQPDNKIKVQAAIKEDQTLEVITVSSLFAEGSTEQQMVDFFKTYATTMNTPPPPEVVEDEVLLLTKKMILLTKDLQLIQNKILELLSL